MRAKQKTLSPHKLLLVTVFCALIPVASFVHGHYQPTWVVGQSMTPTLQSGDFLIVDKDAYADTTPKRGDIILCRLDNDLIIKRVVGLPGEVLRVQRGTLYVNGRKIDESYPDKGELCIKEGRLFHGRYAILGDNRDVPASIATFGIVKKDDIIGKVIYRIPSG